MVETLAPAWISLAWIPSPVQQRGPGGTVESPVETGRQNLKVILYDSMTVAI